jgi:hypothetical protein
MTPTEWSDSVDGVSFPFQGVDHLHFEGNKTPRVRLSLAGAGSCKFHIRGALLALRRRWS